MSIRNSILKGFTIIVLTITLTLAVFAHTASDHLPGYTRVVSADPATRTYTLSCSASPDNTYLRDWYIRPDDGIAGDEPEEAVFLDKPAGTTLTYTFQHDTFYHIGCIIVNDTNASFQWRGDLHLDLRKGTVWNPDLRPVNGSGKSATLSCIASSGATPTWEVLDAHTGVRTSLGSGTQKSYTVTGAGLYDFFCTADGNTVALPIEFFSEGDPYFPDQYGVPDGVTDTWIRSVCGDGIVQSPETCDDGNVVSGDGCSNTCQVESPSNGTVCFSRVADAPVTCEGGTITRDDKGSCRFVDCSGAQGSLSVQACDKGTYGDPSYFEMYKKSSSGSGITICLGPTCMSGGGYAKSDPYPICSQPPAPVCGNGVVESAETCDDGNVVSGDGCSNTCQVESPSNGTACYQDVLGLPATCTGSITSDQPKWGSCREVLCSDAGGSTQVLACPKSDAQGSYFEMYGQSSTATPPKVCLDKTCIQDGGYVKGAYFPICSGGPSGPVCGNGVVESAETCDDGNVVSGDGCSNTCQVESPSNGTACYDDLFALPASCNGGTIDTDVNQGSCRKVTCSAADGAIQALACPKSDAQGSYFEMYKQAESGTPPQVCLGAACVQTLGYVKGEHFPLCAQAGTGSSIVWIEPTDGLMDVSPTYFHLNVQVPTGEGNIPSTDWEVWTASGSERAWQAHDIGTTRFHTHTPDGTFLNSRAGTGQLAWSTQYKVRMHYNYLNGSSSPWSTWRTFTTGAQQTSNPSAPMWSTVSGFHVERFATGFDVPVHIAFAPPGKYDSLPDDVEPYFYVTELYGKVKVVHKDGSQAVYADNLINFNPFGGITGGAQMGTVGLYVDPSGDLYVGTVYVDNESKVYAKLIHFTSSSDGNTFVSRDDVLSGIPSAPSHQIEQITEGPDGKLYVGFGDALNEHNAQNDSVYAGKIIRVNKDGSGAEIYAKGLRNPFGTDWRPGYGTLYATDNSPDSNDRLLKIVQGHNYLWGQGGNAYVGEAIALLNVSPVDVEFNPGGKGFPSQLDGRLYVAVGGPIYTQGPTRGKEILEFTLDGAGAVQSERRVVRYTGSGYGTPMGLDFGPDGLYFTDIYGEPGFTGAGQTEANVYRLVPGDGNGSGLPSGTYRAGIQIKPWYPKLSGDTIEYIFQCDGIDGSGSYTYAFDFGDGQKTGAGQPPNEGTSRTEYHTYPYQDHQYTVSCVAHDTSSGMDATAELQINPIDYIPEK